MEIRRTMKKIGLPKQQDFSPGTLFVIKEFDVPLVQGLDGRWTNWFGGRPRPYDPRSLTPGNNWAAESFEEWVAVVAGELNAGDG